MGMLDGHSVLILGGGSGLGRGVARCCGAEGATLAIFEISDAKVESLKDEFADALIVQGDASKLDDLIRCREAITARHGKVDAVMCFQGIFDGNIPLKDVPLECLDALFDELFHVNVKSNFLVARVFHDLLESTRGALVLTSSVAAEAADGGGAHYTATKGAVSALTRQLAFEFAPNIRVNAVAPAGIGNSELRGPASLNLSHRKQSDIPKEAFEALCSKLSLMPDLAMPEDYAYLYMFLASHANRIMTGQVVLAEQGGLNRGMISAFALH